MKNFALCAAKARFSAAPWLLAVAPPKSATKEFVMNKQNRKRVVILGGGFGGVHTALHLEKLLRKRNDFEILLSNKENYIRADVRE